MIPKEVKELIKKLVKEAVAEYTKDINDKFDKLNERIRQSEIDIKILREGDNI